MARKDDDWTQADLLDYIRKGFLDCADDTFGNEETKKAGSSGSRQF